jgi:hypothetical protein
MFFFSKACTSLYFPLFLCYRVVIKIKQKRLLNSIEIRKKLSSGKTGTKYESKSFFKAEDNKKKKKWSKNYL